MAAGPTKAELDAGIKMPGVGDVVNLVAVHEVSLGMIIYSPNNTRVIDEKGEPFRGLVESIKAQGVLQPVVIRDHPTKKVMYELVAGERRARASKAAGLKMIPAVHRSLTNEEALAITVTENLQREDLTPFEESEGVAKLLAGGWDVKSIASKLGRALPWVYSRANLRKLTPKWRKAIKDEYEIYRDYSIAHLEIIAKLSPAGQDAFLKRCNSWNVSGVRELKKDVAAYMQTLGGAPWDLETALFERCMITCSNCRKRASFQPGLFDMEEKPEGVQSPEAASKALKKDRCLDGVCWNAKMGAFLRLKEKEMRAEHGNILIINAGEKWGKLDHTHERIQHIDNFERSKKDDKKAIPALVWSGPGAGSVRYLKPRAYTTAAKPGRPKDATGKPVPVPLKERRAALERRRYVLVIRDLQAVLNKGLKGPDSLRVENGNARQLLTLTLMCGTQHRENYADKSQWESAEQMFLNMTDQEILRALWEKITPVLYMRLNVHAALEVNAAKINEVEKISKLLQVDLAALQKKAAEAIPEPKAWAKLNANGSPKSPRRPKSPKPEKAGINTEKKKKPGKKAKKKKEPKK